MLRVRYNSHTGLKLFLNSNVYIFPTSLKNVSWIKTGYTNLVEAQKNSFWNSVIIPAKRRLGVIILDRMLSVSVYDKVVAFELQRIRKACKQKERISVIDLFDMSNISDISEICSIKSPDSLKRYLYNIYVTPHAAHGDYCIQNMVSDGSRVYLIDWESYRRKGTLIFDYIHFFLMEEVVNLEKRWTKVLISWLKNLPTYIKRDPLIDKPILVAYALDRLLYEWRKFSYFGEINHYKLKKYKMLLSYLSTVADENLHGH